jgi:hypothetical protein
VANALTGGRPGFEVFVLIKIQSPVAPLDLVKYREPYSLSPLRQNECAE